MAEVLWTKTVQLQSFPQECQALARAKKEGQLNLYQELFGAREGLVNHLFQ